ncbi:MAG: hypothetical protein GEU68_16870 [Actinobacteria bacterium]|nr:hypothetical protein [Actinomycetota bacterium]
MNSNGFARIATVAIGAAGVVGAHTFAYRLAHASRASHDHALESTGHGYWDLAILLGLAALIIGVGVEMVFGGGRSKPRRALFTWLRLFALQGLTFAVLESLERLVQGPEQLTLLFHEPAFWLAFPLLVLTAAAGCVLLVLARKAGETLARRRRPLRGERRLTLRMRSHSVQVISHVLVAMSRERAPPPRPVV